MFRVGVRFRVRVRVKVGELVSEWWARARLGWLPLRDICSKTPTKKVKTTDHAKRRDKRRQAIRSDKGRKTCRDKTRQGGNTETKTRNIIIII